MQEVIKEKLNKDIKRTTQKTTKQACAIVGGVTVGAFISHAPYAINGMLEAYNSGAWNDACNFTLSAVGVMISLQLAVIGAGKVLENLMEL